MDENKNQEMSVDELLEKLKASLADEPEEKKDNAIPVDDKDIKAVVEAAITIEETEEAAEEKEEPAVQENVGDEVAPDPSIFEEVASEESEAAMGESDVERTLEVVAPDSRIVDEPVHECEVKEEAPEVAAPSFQEEDIFAAWGIERSDLPVKNEEEGDGEKPEYTVPTATRTKIYRIQRIEKKNEYSQRKQTEAQKQSVDYDKTDYSLIKQALGMEKPVDDMDVFEFPTFNENAEDKQKTIDEPRSEFTYQRQKDDIANDYKKMRVASKIKMIFTVICAALLFAVECLPFVGVPLPEAINFEYYPVVNIMLVLQLMLICGAFCYKEIANGFLGMLKFRFSSGSLLAILMFTSVVCNVLLCVFKLDIFTYNFAAAFCAAAIRVFDYYDTRREIIAFEIASSQSKKYVALKVPSEKAERIEGLEEFTGRDSLVLRTEKCSFVENYFQRTEKRNENEIKTNRYLVPITVAVALATLIIGFASKGGMASMVTGVNLTLAVAFPVFVLLSASHPLYKATKRLYKHESTIIGEKAVEEYSGTTMICFDDADAFPSYGVALENLRIYGKGDIETIIEQMGAVFSKLGGPLKHVFSLMTADCPRPYKVKIDGVFENGINAVVDGKTLYIGNVRYMEENGFKVIDKTNEIGGKHFSTMYLAQDGALRAKFFIRYTLDGSFETIVKKLARRGIASVILTGDSNINDELLSRSLDISKLPVKVVRRRDFDTTVVGDRADSGIISRGAIGDLVSAVAMCDKLAGVIGTLRAVRVASAIICVLLVLGSCLLGMHTSISMIYVLLYHLFWLVPSWLVSKFNL